MSQENPNPHYPGEDEELTEAELEMLAGGLRRARLSRTSTSSISLPDLKTFTSPQNITSDSSLLPPLGDVFVGDVKVVKSVDSSYASFFGTTGSTSGGYVTGIPFNITNAFP